MCSSQNGFCFFKYDVFIKYDFKIEIEEKKKE